MADPAGRLAKDIARVAPFQAVDRSVGRLFLPRAAL